jgi:hypothetical protein
MGKHTWVRTDNRRRRGLIAVCTVVALSCAVGVAVAAPTSSTTNVDFAPLTPPHKVLSSTAIGAGKTKSAVVIGGTTTVPADATTVQLTVTVTGTAAGTLNFYPAGRPSGASGQTLSWAPGATASTTIEENVGQSGELTVANSSTASAKVTATLIGYSTEVTAGDINGTGGSAGQVLTNTGTGAQWQTMGRAVASGFCCDSGLSAAGLVAIDAVTVPAGSYAVSADVVYQGASYTIQCFLFAPTSGSVIATATVASGSAAYGSIPLQGLLTTTGGTVGLACKESALGGSVHSDTLVAVQVNSASGSVAH